MKNLQDTKTSADSADLLCTTNPRNRQEVGKTWYNNADKRLDYFLTELKLICNLQNQKKIKSCQLFI